MHKFKLFISIIGIIFIIFCLLAKSVSGLVSLFVIGLIWILRKPLRMTVRSITKNNFIIVVIFGTLIGLAEEVLWYMVDPGIKQTMFKSLYIDLSSTLPAYALFYSIVYLLAKKVKITEKKAFMVGGIFGYIFYFIVESGLFGFQFGGIKGTPIALLLVWELNNFFLNGFLVWLPVYLSDLRADAVAELEDKKY